jgi:hypothetical protein
MLDSPDGVCAGQAGFEYPATSVPFSNFDPLRSSATCRNGCPLSGSLYFADKPPMAVAGHPRRMKMCWSSGRRRCSLVPRAR